MKRKIISVCLACLLFSQSPLAQAPSQEQIPQTNTEIFVPSEAVSEDLSVSFPVDI